MSALLTALIRVAFGIDSDRDDCDMNPSLVTARSSLTEFNTLAVIAIDQADEIITSSNGFLDDSDISSLVIKQPAPTSFPTYNSIRSWRNRRRDTRLFNIYSTLFPRLKATEDILRSALLSAIEKKHALRFQGRYLIIRLKSCIKSSSESVEATIIPETEIRLILSKLSYELELLKQIINFNNELLRFQRNELISSGNNAYLPWINSSINTFSNFSNNYGSSNFMRYSNKNSKDPENDDSDNSFLKDKLSKLRVLRDTYVKLLSVIIEEREIAKNNLESAKECFNRLISLVGSENEEDLSKGLDTIDETLNNYVIMTDSSPSPSNRSSINQKHSIFNLSFDHSRCGDCSISITISHDCINNLTKLQELAIKAAERLSVIVELRERIAEVASYLDPPVNTTTPVSSECNGSIITDEIGITNIPSTSITLSTTMKENNDRELSLLLPDETIVIGVSSRRSSNDMRGTPLSSFDDADVLMLMNTPSSVCSEDRGIHPTELS